MYFKSLRWSKGIKQQMNMCKILRLWHMVQDMWEPPLIYEFKQSLNKGLQEQLNNLEHRPTTIKDLVQ